MNFISIPHWPNHSALMSVSRTLLPVTSTISAAIALCLTICLCCAASLSYAADLNTNLLRNAGFEDIGVLTEPTYGLSNILEWNGPGFAQNHAASGWANGAPLVEGDDFYYAGGGFTMTQEVLLSSGDTASTISAGRGEFDLSAWFSGFSTQTDIGNVNVSFFDSSSTQLGSSFSIATPDTSSWNQNLVRGDIPVGTAMATVTVSSQGSGWADGYVDNVFFQVVEGAAPLGIEVNRTNGDITMTNPNDSVSIEFDYYEITSPGGSLLTTWDSFEDQGLDAIGSGVGEHWTKATGVDSQILAEVFLLGTSEFAAAETQTLAGAFEKLSTQQDLLFRYGLSSAGVLHEGVVSYSGSPPEYDLGDFDTDGDIDSDDWAILRANQHADLTSLTPVQALLRGDLNGDLANNHTDFVAFKTIYETLHGAGSFAAMIATVPEPSTCLLASLAGGLLLGWRRRIG